MRDEGSRAYCDVYAAETLFDFIIAHQAGTNERRSFIRVDSCVQPDGTEGSERDDQSEEQTEGSCMAAHPEARSQADVSGAVPDISFPFRPGCLTVYDDG